MLVWLCAASVPAALGYRTVGELMDAADVVVHGTVASVHASEAPQQRGPATRLTEPTTVTAEILPYAIFKGDAPRRLRVTAIQGMEDSPEFIEGQEVILFLQRGADGQSFKTVGLLQGKLDVVDGVVTRNGTSLSSFLEELRALAPD